MTRPILVSSFGYFLIACSGSSPPSTGPGAAPGAKTGGATKSDVSGAGGAPATGPGKTTKGTPKGETSGGVASADFTCVPGVAQTVVTDCGYPYSSANALTNVAFNESEVLRAIVPSSTTNGGVVRLFYNDEHALTLGVRQLVTVSASGSSTSNFTVSEMSTVPGSIMSPAVGAMDSSGLDPSNRPMWPALYLTDVTGTPTARSGDWQLGGKGRAPDAVFGTWKSAVRTVDNTASPAKVTITPDPDPAKNNCTLPGGDSVPGWLTVNEGYGAEVRWNVSFTPGHSYRIQVLVHDGDQNKVGGDSGEGCIQFCAGGTVCAPGTEEYLTAEGAIDCKPVGGSPDAGIAKKDTGTACAPGTVDYLTSEGSPTCVNVPGTNTPCGPGTASYLTSEGAICLPIPTNGTCPKGYRLDPSSEGSICI